jgi:Glycosyltransferase
MINLKTPNYADSPISTTFLRFGYQPVEFRPTVSILTPFYNTDEVFLETVESVLLQSFQEWEWIIVDDGSTDSDALNRLATTARRDSRIKVIPQANAGPSAARNTAYSNSSGKYLCLLDSDDLLEPTYIEKCVWFLESQPEFAFVNSWSVTFGDYEYLWDKGFETGKEHVTANSGPPMSVIRRDAYAATGGFDESIRKGHEDWAFWLSIAEKGHWGYTIPEYLEWYRRRDHGRFAQIMKESKTNQEFEKYIEERFSHLKDNFPTPKLKEPTAYETLNFAIPFSNLIHKASHQKRALFLLPWMVTGGADKVNLDWIKGMVEREWNVTICTTLQSPNNWYSEFSKLTSDIFILTNFLHTAEYPRFLDYIIRSRQIDVVVIAGSTFGYHLLPYLKSCNPSVAFVDLCHVEEPHWLNGGHPRFGTGYQDLLDLNIVTTNHLRNWMIERGADGRKIEVCYTGIDPSYIDSAAENRTRNRSKLNVPDDVTLLVFAGRLCEQKRPYLLVRILKELKAKNLAFLCLIIGDGELKQQLVKLLKDYSIEDNTRMLGVLSHEQWIDVLSASDVFLMPSDYEGISIALYESMAMENVVPVMSDVGGQSEIIDVTTGYLIPKNDEELPAYVDTLTSLMANPSDRFATANRGSERIRRDFTYEGTIDKVIKCLNTAIDRRHITGRGCLPSGLAREMAVFAVEYKRLSFLADNLWSQSMINTSISAPSHDASASTNLIGVINLLSVIAKTKLGKAIFTNSILCKLGNWIFGKLQERQRRKK